jgi:hypothetical protein
MTTPTLNDLHRKWRERAARPIHGDADAVFERLETPLRLMLERWSTGGTERDFLHAAAALGRCLSELDSPEFVVATLIDHLVESVPFGVEELPAHHHAQSRVESAKTALLSGYVRAREDLAQRRALEPFLLPIVPVSGAVGTYAVYAAFDHDDPSEVVEHAERIVRKLRSLRARVLHLSGSAAACRVLRDLAELVGIRVHSET